MIDAYFQERGLVRPQLDSFDDFIANGLQDVVKVSSSLTVTESVGPEENPDFLVSSLAAEKP